jgi:hypothetical protein
MQTDDGPQTRKARNQRSSSGTRWRVLGLAFCFAAHVLPAAEIPERPTEAQVKAAYLYNFGKFVRWQTPPTDTFDICVIGKNPFGAALSNTVAGERIEGKSIVARDVPATAEPSHCRILFITTGEEDRLKAAFAVAKRNGSLTVSDMPHFADRGGMIGLVNQNGRIRFEVNLAAAEEAGLNVSSELLKVAVKVIGLNQVKETGR